MGRPRKDIEQKLARVVTFRLTNGELKKLEKLGITCSQRVGVLIRAKLFTGSYPKAAIPDITLKLYAELNRIGVNLNQLTRLVNAGRLPLGLMNSLNELSEQQQTIINHLLNDRG